jgi:hypothetical protein
LTQVKARTAAAIFVIAAAVLVLTGCSSAAESAAPKPVSTYGGMPSFLPKQTIHPDSVLTGTAASPALTTEGDTVKVESSEGSVRATVSGPEVPGEGLPYLAGATTCTWTVTLSDPSAAMPISVADFTATDHLGTVYHPALVPGQPAPPAVLTPGHTVSFELRAVMVVGEGLMQWSPGSKHTLASWDFEVEND